MTGSPATAAQVPVIVGIGEVIERSHDLAHGREPVALMEDALRAADADGGGGLLAALDSIDLVGQVGWPYRDPVGLLCGQLAILPARRVNASMGGETPIRLIHEAALRIANGATAAAAIVGGEALNTLIKARRAGIVPDWTPAVPREMAVRVDFDRLPLSESARLAGATDPVQIYPFYENAVTAARSQTPAERRVENARLWAGYAQVAAGNPSAWIRSAPDAEEIAVPSPANRMIAFPYPKLMVANPSVNQAAAVILCSLEAARAAGVAESRLVYPWGGAAAAEPADFLARDRYDRSTAQQAVLNAAVEIAGGEPNAIDPLELYSCFPIVPRMALESLAALGATRDVAPTVTGGLTFFGGPFNNYMTHAVCAMVRRLREGDGRIGLLYGQGGVVSKHHALVLGKIAPPRALSGRISVQADADAARGAAPALVERYAGPAVIETYTVRYDAAGEPAQGIVIARTPVGERLIARVAGDDTATMAPLLAMDRTPVGLAGEVRMDPSGAMVWAQTTIGAGVHPRHHAVAAPTKAAVIMAETGETLSYGALEGLANQWARQFRALGLRRGAGVAVLMENGPDSFWIVCAAQRSGLFLTPLSTRLTAAEAAFIIADCGAGLLVVSSGLRGLAGAIGDLLPSLRIVAADAALGLPATPIGDESPGADMLYSSGTTGRPKGIRPALPEGPVDVPNPLAGFAAARYGFGFYTIYLSPAPLYHAAPLRWAMAVLALGGTVVILTKFDAELALAAIERYSVTASQWVPTHFVRMLKIPEAARARYNVSSMRIALHAAAPCPEQVKRAMLAWWGPVLYEYYGGTENFGATAIGPEEWLAHPGSVGQAVEGVIRICDEDGEALPAGATGEVYFESLLPFTEYHGDAEKTRASRNRHGWASYGDIGHVDAQGYLYLTDRKDFTIISGGVNIYPREIEEVLIRHPKVQDVAVIGAPDAEMGERVLAVVEPAGGIAPNEALAAELATFAAAHLGSVKLPRRIEFMAELPRQPTGKIFKRLLRERYKDER